MLCGAASNPVFHASRAVELYGEIVIGDGGDGAAGVFLTVAGMALEEGERVGWVWGGFGDCDEGDEVREEKGERVVVKEKGDGDGEGKVDKGGYVTTAVGSVKVLRSGRQVKGVAKLGKLRRGEFDE